MRVSIRAADTSELGEVGRLRYRVYVDEMARPQRFADHEERTILEPLDHSGIVLIARDGADLVGTVRWNRGLPGGYAEFFCPDGGIGEDEARLSVTSKLMVLPDYRASTVAVRLSQATFELAALGHGALLNFIDCNPHLHDFFAGLGFEDCGLGDHPEYGTVYRMVLCLPDVARLRALRSPFAEIAARRFDAQDLDRARRLLGRLRPGAPPAARPSADPQRPCR